MKTLQNTAFEFTPEKVKDQVGRIQELVYEYVKRLSKLKRDQEMFLSMLESRQYEN
jgi:hypothetical protein